MNRINIIFKNIIKSYIKLIIYYQLNNIEEADLFVSHVQKLIWNIHTGIDDDFIGAEEIHVDAIAELFGIDKTIH